MKKLSKEFTQVFRPDNPKVLYGELGIKKNGLKTIEVSNRKGFVYVRLRSNTSEFIQAFNEVVGTDYYGVPVIVERQGNRYVVIGRDNQRYSEWNTQGINGGGGGTVTQYLLPKHGNSHAFDDGSSVGGGDIAWIYSRQFLPLLAMPYNGVSPNVYIAAGVVRKDDGTLRYMGNTGTISLMNYNPPSGSVLALITLDTVSGNPYIIVNSGTYIPPTVTNKLSLFDYLPNVLSQQYIPLALARLSSGTTAINWDNLYDARLFYDQDGYIMVNGTNYVDDINFLGAGVSVAYANNTANVTISDTSGGGSGGNDGVLFHVEGRLATGTNMANLYMFTQDENVGNIYLYLDSAGVTGSTTVDINLTRSGTTQTIFSTQANRPSLIYTDADKWVYGTPNITSFGQGDVLSLDLDEIAYLSDTLVVAKYVTGSSSSSSLEVGGIQNVGQIDLGTGLSVSNDGGGIVTLSSKIVQIVNYETGAMSSGTSIIPFDDSVPQSSEGTEFMTLAITPTSVTNDLYIDVVAFVATSAGRWLIAALFQDSNSDALAAIPHYMNTANGGVNFKFTHKMAAGTINATTFKVRIGAEAAATITFNGQVAARKLGGIMASSITITEVKT